MVTYTLVCDGRSDCSTGRDENICQEFDYIECQFKEKSCASWGCYSQADTCDLYRDCRDGTDEQNCGGQCPHQICTSGRCALRHWFNDGEVDCPVFSTGKAEDENTDAILSDCIFSCKSSGCISLAMIGDGHEDCKGPEGALDELLGRLEGTVCTLTYTLRNVTPGSVNATSGSMNATSWAPRCVLYRDGYGDVIGCRDGSHLEDCEEFMCPEGYVKCPRSYCVPLHYLLDGRVDCALGEDEGVQDLRARSNLACMSTGGSPVFLHPSLVCDGVRQCPLGDDEWDCFVWCAPGLVCMGGAVVVAQGNTQLALQNPSNLFDQRTKYVDLSHQLLTSDFFSKVDGKLEHVLFLRLSNCGLTSLQTLIFGKMSTYSNFYGVESNGAVEKYGTRDFRTLLYADLSYNQLISLGGKWGGLGQMVNLRFLNLSHNRGLVVTRVDFQKCAGHVQTLDLSYTRVAVLTRELLSDFQQLLALYLTGCPLSALRPVFPRTLQTLDLRHTDLVTIEPNAFNEITSLEALYAPDYKICCPQVRGPTVPAYACKAENDALSSCTDLMGQPILKALLWIVGVAALLGNFIVVIYRIVYDRRVLVKSYGMFILNLSISDLLMGLYLILIAGADVRFQGSYVWHEREWRMGTACKVAGFLSTCSSESSAIFIFLITLDRFLVIKFPFGQVRFSLPVLVVSCTVAWLIGLTIALLPLLPPFDHWVIYSTSGMCLGLPLTSEKTPGWQFSFLVFIVFNFFLFICIALGQFMIYRAMSNSMLQAVEGMGQLTERRRQQEFEIAKQLSLIAVSDFLCWFPIGVMGLMAISGQDIGGEVYAWSAVLVLPVNSALNPVLYTVPAVRKKWAEIKDKHLRRKFTRSKSDVRTTSKETCSTTRTTTADGRI